MILALAGSLAPRSRSTAMLHWVSERLSAAGTPAQLVTLRDVPADDLIAARYDSAGMQSMSQRFQNARALIIASPVYKGSLGGALKSLLDLLPENTLAGKVVLPLLSGGGPTHMLALEYGLKPVLSILGSRNILPGVYATDKQIRIGDDGAVSLDEDLAGKLNGAADMLLGSIRDGRG